MKNMYQKIVEEVSQLKRGMVWCKKCGREQKVDSANCLAHGWPKCCGETMTIDHPSTWVKKGTKRNLKAAVHTNC